MRENLTPPVTRFAVSDTGVRIAADKLEAVFVRCLQVAKNDRRGIGAPCLHLQSDGARPRRPNVGGKPDRQGAHSALRCRSMSPTEIAHPNHTDWPLLDRRVSTLRLEPSRHVHNRTARVEIMGHTRARSNEQCPRA